MMNGMLRRLRLDDIASRRSATRARGSRTYLNQTGGLYSIDPPSRPGRMIPFRRWVQGFLALAGVTLAVVGATAGQFPRLPKLGLPAGTPRGVEDLAVERLLRRDPPISTALADATTEAPPLDGYDPPAPIPLPSLGYDGGDLYEITKRTKSIEYMLRFSWVSCFRVFRGGM